MIRKFTMDWSLNIGNVVSITTFLLAGVAAWYDVKTDVKVNHREAELRFGQVEGFIQEQKIQNQLAEKQRDALLSEVRSTIKEDNREMKQEIRELRNDVMRHSIAYPTSKQKQ